MIPLSFYKRTYFYAFHEINKKMAVDEPVFFLLDIGDLTGNNDFKMEELDTENPQTLF